MNEHDQYPTDPKDGDKFRCSRCGYRAEFIKLDDDHEGEWADS